MAGGDGSAAYDGEVAWTDAQIGKLLEVLDRRHLLDQALIVYTADHGDEFLEHGRFDHGHSLYEELVHVPLVMRVPGRGPTRVAVPVSMIDVAPTILESLGLRAHPSFRGEGLLSLANGAARREMRLYAETQATKPHHLPHYTVREGQLKYILRFAGNDDAALVGRELFDLQRNPAENASLDATGHPLEREAMAYAAAARHTRSRRDAVIDADVEQQLEALGYVK